MIVEDRLDYIDHNISIIISNWLYRKCPSDKHLQDDCIFDLQFGFHAYTNHHQQIRIRKCQVPTRGTSLDSCLQTIFANMSLLCGTCSLMHTSFISILPNLFLRISSVSSRTISSALAQRWYWIKRNAVWTYLYISCSPSITLVLLCCMCILRICPFPLHFKLYDPFNSFVHYFCFSGVATMIDWVPLNLLQRHVIRYITFVR